MDSYHQVATKGSNTICMYWWVGKLAETQVDGRKTDSAKWHKDPSDQARVVLAALSPVCLANTYAIVVKYRYIPDVLRGSIKLHNDLPLTSVERVLIKQT